MRLIILRILTFCAKLILRRRQPLIIAITGSAGKTTAKEAIYTALNAEPKFRGQVARSFGNLNTEFGAPLAIAGLKFNEPKKWQWLMILPIFKIKCLLILLRLVSYPKILILELAADKPGDIKWLTGYIQPKIVIVTAIGPAHLQSYPSIEAIAKEKSILISHCQENGWVILNKNSDYYQLMEEKVPAGVKLLTIDALPENSYQDFSRAVGKYFGIKMSDVDSALKRFSPPPGRFDVIRHKNLIILDSSYNSNPLSLRLVLNRTEQLKQQIKPPRVVGIIGDMLELGEASEKLHRELKAKVRMTVDYLVTVGRHSRLFGADEHFSSVEEAIPAVLKLIQPGDMILVKGSHGIHLEKLVDKLKHYNKD